MFAGLSENEKEQMRDIVNRLLSVNILVKAREPELYHLARRHRATLDDFFKALGWNFVLDDRHDCVFVHSPEALHRLRLTREESIWILVLRLLYQEKRSELALSDFPLVSLHEIRAKYATFQIPFVNKTRLQDLIKLGVRNSLFRPLDTDLRSDDCRFTLYHSLLHAVSAEKIEDLSHRIARYTQDEGGEPESEVAEEA
ncbi:MAG: DUF4194 domain-containing protein [Selenomonadales bacterium]|nr:DUF4194 domain-containing protein [Selenomonadales bacterium]